MLPDFDVIRAYSSTNNTTTGSWQKTPKVPFQTALRWLQKRKVETLEVAASKIIEKKGAAAQVRDIPERLLACE